jgi:hypothetical protein
MNGEMCKQPGESVHLDAPRTHHRDTYFSRDVDVEFIYDDALDANQHPGDLPDWHTARLNVYVARTRV